MIIGTIKVILPGKNYITKRVEKNYGRNTSVVKIQLEGDRTMGPNVTFAGFRNLNETFVELKQHKCYSIINLSQATWDGFLEKPVKGMNQKKFHALSDMSKVILHLEDIATDQIGRKAKYGVDVILNLNQ